MVARGDLGVEVPLSQVPKLQKMMIRRSYLAGKPVVTATQMLESMIHNPRPTRAEVSDVANAIYDSTSAVMLSGETAVGKYPIQALHMMNSIIEEAEADFDYRGFFDSHADIVYHDITSLLTLAAVKTAYHSADAKAIFAFTSSGITARQLSRLRPAMPIVALTSNVKTYHQLAVNWGIIPCLRPVCKTLDEAHSQLSQFALEKKLINYGDLVVITAGSPFGVSGTTNMMMVESIGDVLARGAMGYGKAIHGNVSLVLSASARKPYSVSGQLLLLTACDPSYLPLLREASGFIIDSHVDDAESDKYALEIAKELNKTCIVRADGAKSHIKEGQLVTIDPEKATVFNGVVF
jgi:pyruvate kinase